MLELLIDTIFVMFGWRCFSSESRHFCCTNCAPLLVDLFFLYSYEAYLKDFSQEEQNKLVRSFNIHVPLYRYVLLLNNSRFGDFVDRIPVYNVSHWAWNKGYYRYRSICFIPWPTPRNWQWGPVKNETLRQKSLFQFSHCEVSIY